MKVIFSSFYATYFMLLHGIFGSVVETYSAGLNDSLNNYAGAYKPGRSKRSLFREMPAELKIRVKREAGEEIELNWIKKEEYLANKYLPVIKPSGHAYPNVMDDVGEFVVYDDPERCSAVVYFGKSRSFFGVIGMNHYVSNLPYEFDTSGNYPRVVGEPYVMRRDHTPDHEFPDIPDNFLLDLIQTPDLDRDLSRKRQSDSCPGPSTKSRRTEQIDQVEIPEDVEHAEGLQTNKIRRRRWQWTTEQYFSETLVLVTRDIAEIFNNIWGDEHYIEYVVKYYIIYFNALDMLLYNLASENNALQINIAKIVIEDKSSPFNFLNNDQFEFTEMVTQLQLYLRNNQHRYPPDSFDHIFISTSRPIKDNSVFVNEVTKHDADLYDARKNNDFYNAIPITAVKFDSDYVVGVQEITKILKMDFDSWKAGLRETGQCSSIMQNGSSKCDHCLKWNDFSKEQFMAFFRENRHRCFLLNEPRSVRPPGASRYLTPIIQCKCFGYFGYIPNKKGRRKLIIDKNECDVPLLCRNVVGERSYYEYTIRPFDGTPCGTNKHICWNERCVLSGTR